MLLAVGVHGALQHLRNDLQAQVLRIAGRAFANPSSAVWACKAESPLARGVRFLLQPAVLGSSLKTWFCSSFWRATYAILHCAVNQARRRMPSSSICFKSGIALRSTSLQKCGYSLPAFLPSLPHQQLRLRVADHLWHLASSISLWRVAVAACALARQLAIVALSVAF